MRKHHTRKSVCLITGGINGRNIRLQPWRYLSEVALQLKQQGHEVTVVTDGSQTETAVSGTHAQQIPSVSNPFWQENRPLLQTITEIQPDIVLWHIGLTSFLHQRFDPGLDVPVVGVFTSPIYEFTDLARIGVRRIVAGRQLSGVHTMGTMLPHTLLRQIASRNKHLQQLVVQTQTTRYRLQQSGLTRLPVSVIGPGVDAVWANGSSTSSNYLRQQLGYHDEDVVVIYYGSSAPLRGLHTLIKAVQMVGTAVPTIKLLILNRRHVGELMKEDTELRQLLSEQAMQNRGQIISGFLAPDDLVNHILAADIVALPFELVPSDAPLSLLEAKALDKPVVTTEIACLPELVADGLHYLARPADASSLAHALTRAAHELPSNKHTSPSIRGWQQVGEEWSQLIQAV